MKGNDYYSIAVNDLQYLEATLHLPFYNNIVAGCQQIVEKMLKSIAEYVCTEDIKTTMNSHNLKNLYICIRKEYQDISLDMKELTFLKDFYYDARYPGENYIEVDKDTCEECVDIMYTVIREVNRIRIKHNMQIYDI